MSYVPSVDDLRLVCAIQRHGSIGGAARELHIAQPSASARLAAVERQLGLVLFERNTTGARATSAGQAYVTEATHLLDVLTLLPSRVREGAAATLLRVGAPPSLATIVFPAIEAWLDQSPRPLGMHQLINHGETLITYVGEGSLDLAVVAIAEQLSLPPGLMAHPIGTDPLVMLLSTAQQTSSKKRPFTGVVPYHCLDHSGPHIAARVSSLGGTPSMCATSELAINTARSRDVPLLLAKCLARHYANDTDTIAPAPMAVQFTLYLVCRQPASDMVIPLADALAHQLDLTRPTC